MPLSFRVGQDSSPAADVHVGLLACGTADSKREGRGSWRTRADLEVCPTNYAAFPILGQLSGIGLKPASQKRGIGGMAFGEVAHSFAGDFAPFAVEA